MNTVDISGVDKAQLLAALFNRSQPMGMGWLQAAAGPERMTTEDAQKLIDKAQAGSRSDDHGRNFNLDSDGDLYFDYLFGRPLKVDLSGDEVEPWGYDRDNGGPGTFSDIVDEVRRLAKLEAGGAS